MVMTYVMVIFTPVIYYRWNKNYIIDWFGSYSGDLLSDVAHTYLITRNVPRFPGVSPIWYTIMRLAGSLLAHIYLAAFDRKRPINRIQFAKWLVVRATERTVYGLPDEKKKLVEFIESCENTQSHPETWIGKV